MLAVAALEAGLAGRSTVGITSRLASLKRAARAAVWATLAAMALTILVRVVALADRGATSQMVALVAVAVFCPVLAAFQDLAMLARAGRQTRLVAPEEAAEQAVAAGARLAAQCLAFLEVQVVQLSLVQL